MRQHISQKKSIDTDAASVFTMQTMVMSATGPSSSYVIAVVGHEGVGKTSVIRRALKTWGGSMPLTTHTPEGHASK
jgi:hypothetical protein